MAGGVIAALLLFAAQAAGEPLEQRLIRTIQTGVPQRVELEEIRAHVKSLQTDFVGHVLARTALVTLGKDEGFPEWPLPRLLGRVLDLLQRGGSHAYPPRPGIADGFGGDDLAFTVVYALMMSGQSEAAIATLEAHLQSESEFVRGVALQALRNIGDAKATRLIQKMADGGRDRNLPENLLADLHYPFLVELQQRLHLVPPERRDRKDLLALAREGCGERSSVATYFLGFLSEDDPQASRELDFLRSQVRADCFHNRYFAIRSLALRSPERIELWSGLLREEKDGWQRAQLARILFARFGRDFAGPALQLLAEEPVQYVQWELMHGAIDARRGNNLRDYWDLWLPTTLTYKLYFLEGGSQALADADLDEILRRLEGGARPRDPWVRNHLFYRLAQSAPGRHTRRYLRLFDAHPEKAKHWWILSGLSNPEALPLLRYWRSLPSEESQAAQLDSLIQRLEQGGAGSRLDPSPTCCLPTRQCLLSWLAAGPPPGLEIRNAEQARAWLAGPEASGGEPRIRFIDVIERTALVTRPGRQGEERWEHLYGCWRRVDGPQRR